MDLATGLKLEGFEGRQVSDLACDATTLPCTLDEDGDELEQMVPATPTAQEMQQCSLPCAYFVGVLMPMHAVPCTSMVDGAWQVEQSGIDLWQLEMLGSGANELAAAGLAAHAGVATAWQQRAWQRPKKSPSSLWGASRVAGILRLGLKEGQIDVSFVLETPPDCLKDLLWCPRHGCNQAFQASDKCDGWCHGKPYRVWIQEHGICSHHLQGTCNKGGEKCKFPHVDRQKVIDDSRLKGQVHVIFSKLPGLITTPMNILSFSAELSDD
eukprot:Skav206347  [mRNA]  locus=scaffold3448:50946:52923:+ [translate_table: standard]